MHTASS